MFPKSGKHKPKIHDNDFTTAAQKRGSSVKRHTFLPSVLWFDVDATAGAADAFMFDGVGGAVDFVFDVDFVVDDFFVDDDDDDDVVVDDEEVEIFSLSLTLSLCVFNVVDELCLDD